MTSTAVMALTTMTTMAHIGRMPVVPMMMLAATMTPAMAMVA